MAGAKSIFAATGTGILGQSCKIARPQRPRAGPEKRVSVTMENSKNMVQKADLTRLIEPNLLFCYQGYLWHAIIFTGLLGVPDVSKPSWFMRRRVPAVSFAYLKSQNIQTARLEM